MNMIAASLLGVGCISILSYLLICDGLVTKLWHLHRAALDNHYRFLFLEKSASHHAAVHMVSCAVLAILALYLHSLPTLLLLPLLASAPEIVLSAKERKKRDALSEQLAPWLTILAGSLKSSPNITDAFASSTGLVLSPLREEIDLLVKEVQLGEHLDQAMRRSAGRVRSPLYSSAMTTLLVARRSGGDLPTILDENSGTLREMERLAGVVRTKTAEGRSQMFVLVLLPFVMVAALQKVDPGMIPGLAQSGMGQIVLASSIGLWLASMALAYRITKVDI